MYIRMIYRGRLEGESVYIKVYYGSNLVAKWGRLRFGDVIVEKKRKEVAMERN